MQMVEESRFAENSMFFRINTLNVFLKNIDYQYFLNSGSSEVKASACNVGDPGSIPGLGRSPGEGNGNPLHYSCMENPPWMEEPGGLQSMGSQRVGHD